MANGILGTPTALSASANTTIYEVPGNTFSVVTVNICNRGSADALIRVALADLDTPTTAEYIEYDSVLLGNGVLERSGIVLNATKKVVVYVSTSDVTAVVYGIETPTS